MNTPLVSIIIPCYNAAPWIAAAIESALLQTWPAKEVIVVDDGSRDKSLSVARRFEARGVRVLSQTNRGASAARNQGLRLARGELVQFLDADDLLAPDKLARQVRAFSGGGDLILSSSAWARFNAQPEDAIFLPQSNWRDLSGVEFLLLHYEDGGMMQPAAWLAPRSLLDRVGGWDESLSLNDDGEYFARVMLASTRIVFCSEACSYYRTGVRGNLSARSDQRSLESLYHSVELTLRHLLAVDQMPRTRAAAAHAWKITAFELYPRSPALARRAEENSQLLGGSKRPLPAGRRFQLASRVLGWRLAKRFFV